MSETTAPADLESRLAYLESQNEGLKRVGLLGLLLVLILGGIVVYQAWADLSGVTTTGIVFQDERQPRNALLTSTAGHLALVPALPLGTLPELQSYNDMDFQGLGIYDSKGRVRILLGVNSQDVPMIGVIGEKGETVWTPLQLKTEAPPGTPATPAPPTPGAPGTPATP